MVRVGQPILAQYMSYAEDRQRHFDEAALAHQAFTPMRSNTLNVGYSDSAHFLRIDLHALRGQQPLGRYLTVASIDADEVTMLAPIADSKSIARQHLGILTAPESRPTKLPISAFDLELIPPETPFVYVRIFSQNAIFIKPWLYTQEEMTQHIRQNEWRLIFVGGIFLMVFLICVLIYRISRFSALLWLALCVVLVMVIELSCKEYGFIYFWHRFPAIAPAVLTILLGWFLSCFSMAVASSLRIPRVQPLFDRICTRLAVASSLLTIPTVLGAPFFFWAMVLLTVVYLIAAIVFIVAAFVAMAKGMSGAIGFGFMQCALSLLVIGVTVESFGPADWDHVFFPIISSDFMTLCCMGLSVFTLHVLTVQTASQKYARLRERENAMQLLETQVLLRTIDLENARRSSDILAKHQRKALATITHELRTPLSAIIGMVRMLHNNLHVAASARTDLATVGRLGQQLLQIVDDGLAFVGGQRQWSGQAQNAVDMTAFRHDMQSICSWVMENHNLDFYLHWDETIPKSLVFDERAFKQISINLMTNAARYCAKGRADVSFQFKDSQEMPAAHVELTVADTGHGMAPSKLAHLFEPFQTSQHSSGLGLGLSIVKDLTQACGGTIEVKSELNQGTVFTVNIPVVIPPRAEEVSIDGNGVPDILPASHIQQDVMALEHAHSSEQSQVTTAQVARAMELLPDMPRLHELIQIGAHTKIEQWLVSARTRVPEQEIQVHGLLNALGEYLDQLNYGALQATVALGDDSGLSEETQLPKM
jgi:two-component system, sensor histidine kinase LadS